MVLNWYTKPIYPQATGRKAFSGSFWQMKREQDLQSHSVLQFANPLWGKETAQIEKKKKSEHITISHNLMQRHCKFQPQKWPWMKMISFIYSISYTYTCFYFFFSIYAFNGQHGEEADRKWGRETKVTGTVAMFAPMWPHGTSCKWA